MTQPDPAAPPRARRTSADYHWTYPKVMAFLDALARHGKVAEAARAVGMSRNSAYRLRARLSGGPLEEGFELARQAGIARRLVRPRWAGPGVAVRSQDDAQGYSQGDGFAPQGDSSGDKVTLSGRK